MKPAVVFVWANFGPYHIDRLEAAAAAVGDTHRVIGIEIAGASQVYPWDRTETVSNFERVTLFPDRKFESISSWRIFVASARACLKTRARHVFFCHYERIDTTLIAWLLRLIGHRVYVMIESKFDDRPRFLGRELLKKVFFLPYLGALVGGERSRDYLRFFGFDTEAIYFGYDTVSMDRIRRLAGVPAAPAGVGFNDRHFTIVARLVPKKNIVMALAAYANYCRLAGSSVRELHICGSGELESELRAAANAIGSGRVVFRGFVQSAEVARVLSSTLALILPSVEEQWGLVVNEALAMGVPILCSTNVGARDLLVRTAINGYTFESDNPSGLSRLLHRLGSDEAEWLRLAEGSSRLAPLADTVQFGGAIRQIVVAETKTMKVLVLSHVYLEPENRKNIHALAALMGVECVLPRSHMHIFSNFEFKPERTDANLFFPLLPIRLFGSQYFLRGLLPIFRKYRPDIAVIEYNPWSAMFFQVAFLRAVLLRKTKLICIVKKNTYRKSRLFGLKYIITKLSLRQVDHIIAASQMAARLLKTMSSFPGRKITVCHPLGIDTSLFSPRRESTRRREEAIVVGYCGRLDVEKGIIDLVEAVRQLQETTQTPVVLKLLGQGARQGKLDQQIVEWQREYSWLTTYPPVPNADVADFLRGVDIFVLPSHRLEDHEEHDAHALLEALASGVVCVGTNSGIIPELLGDGIGVLVEPEKPEELSKALRGLVESDAQRQALGQRARQKALNEFALNVIASKKLLIFQSAVNGKN